MMEFWNVKDGIETYRCTCCGKMIQQFVDHAGG